MYDYDYFEDGTVAIRKYRGNKWDAEVEARVILRGGVAVSFLREMNRITQEEYLEGCDLNNILIRQNLMAEYF
jgi:hypothetical protein